MANVYTLKWGILATGGIAQTFTKDLVIDPNTRGVSDVKHEVVAAASSSSKERAASFLKDCGCPDSAKAYGSYKELVEDPDIDIIYVATPHSHHYQNARLCLEAGKNVLCEKALTVNAAQAEILVNLAKEKNLFFMEAVWTRYFPLSKELREKARKGEIGKVTRVFADVSFGTDVEKTFGTKHRLVNLDLAGGAMLDLGIYSITWIFQFLYHILPQSERVQPSVVSSITKYEPTGADEITSVIMNFPSTGAHGIATTNLRVSTEPNGFDDEGSGGIAVRIQGTKGEIQIIGNPFRPNKYRIIRRPEKGQPPLDSSVDIKTEERPPGHGMFWEADECARCLRDGKKESEGLTWEESLVIMRVMDDVRKQNDFKYPDALESTEYPLSGF